MLELHTVFNKIDELLQQLIRVLELEQQILIDNSQPHTLSQIIDDKTQLLIELKLLDEKRLVISEHNNLLPAYETNEALAKQWHTIVATTRSLAQMNNDNGTILQMRMEKTQQAIDFFHTVNGADCYTNVGYANTDTVSTKRAKA